MARLIFSEPFLRNTVTIIGAVYTCTSTANLYFQVAQNHRNYVDNVVSDAVTATYHGFVRPLKEEKKFTYPQHKEARKKALYYVQSKLWFPPEVGRIMDLIQMDILKKKVAAAAAVRTLAPPKSA
jgi:hypothetical protein